MALIASRLNSYCIGAEPVGKVSSDLTCLRKADLGWGLR